MVRISVLCWESASAVHSFSMSRIHKDKVAILRVNGQDTEESNLKRVLCNRLYFTQEAMDKYFEQYNVV